MAWLRFRMNLSSSSQESLIMGELQVFMDNDDKPEKILPATSGIPFYQHLKAEDLVARGPIPSSDSAGIRGYFVQTTPLNRTSTPGIEGNFYWIDIPAQVKINGVTRSEFGIHFDARVPGSAGCVVFPNPTDWRWFEDFMADYRKKGFEHIALVVEYNRVDALPAPSPLLTIASPKSGQTVVARQPFSFFGKAQAEVKKIKVTADPPANHLVGEATVDELGAWTVRAVLVSTGRNRSFKITAFDSASLEIDSTQIKLTVVTDGQDNQRRTSVFSVNEPQSGEQRRVQAPIRFAGTASPNVKRIIANADANGRPVTIGNVEPRDGEWSFNQVLLSGGERKISLVAQDDMGNQLQVSTMTLTLLPGPIDLSKMLASHDGQDFRSVAKPHIPTLVKAFQDQGIFNPIVYAYACSAVSRESSWNPRAENTTDPAANTGYPGRGLAQITWKFNYEAVSKVTGIDFVGDPNLMFDPYKSLRAKAAFYQLNGMIPLIESGRYEAAAGIYNAGDRDFRSTYTRNVALDVPRWLPVFVGA